MIGHRLRTVIVAVYALIVVGVAIVKTPATLGVVDGQAYMEMAKSMAERGSQEIENGLSERDSLDLVIDPTVKIGPHLFGKYPPLYAFLGAPAYALGKVKGLEGLNSFSLGVVILAYWAIARRVLTPARALVTALLLPFVVPLLPYAFTVLPHLVSAALVLASVAAFARTLRPASGGRTFLWALLSGLLAGLGIGVRVQILVPAAVLLLSALIHCPRRLATVSGLALGQATCVAAMAALNQQRFGSPNPISYGPVGVPGGPSPLNTAAGFATFGNAAMFTLIALSILIARRYTPSRRAQTAAAVAAIVVAILAVPGVRHSAANMGMCACAFLVNANAWFAGWLEAALTFDHINKPVFACAPFLVLGFLGTLYCSARRAPPVVTTLAWTALATMAFVSTTEPDPAASDVNPMGFYSLSPRYLVDTFPMLVLLGMWMLRRVRAHPLALLLGAASAAPLGYLYAVMPAEDVGSSAKFAMIMVGSIALAAVVAMLFFLRRSAPRILVFACTVAMTYAAFSTFEEDTRALRKWGHQDEVAVAQVEAVTPQSFVLVGWGNGRDFLYPIRAERNAIWVNAWVDDDRALADTIRVFAARGRPIYYLGDVTDRIKPTIEREYHIVPVLSDPRLWRFDPR